MQSIRWRKLGLVFAAAGDRAWNKSHAQVPTALVMNDRIRVFYSTRDAGNRTSTGFFEVEAGDPTRVVHVHNKPVLSPGSPGAFDDCGAMASAIVRDGEETLLYYIGWNVRNTVPFHNSIGLAFSRDDAVSFERISAGPILDRSPIDPYFCTTAHVRRSERWEMWYSSGTEWRQGGSRLESLYHIKYATSENGIEWRREGVVAIDFNSDMEGGLVRPAVVETDGGFRMWYSRRSWHDYRGGESSYRIGYAESADGLRWQRRDAEAGITVSETGWDAEMIEYPNAVWADGKLYLFYNGNGFGSTGIGVAIAE
jgi:predicted GH43/DUF377 family glycosyl hydrolase